MSIRSRSETLGSTNVLEMEMETETETEKETETETEKKTETETETETEKEMEMEMKKEVEVEPEMEMPAGSEESATRDDLHADTVWLWLVADVIEQLPDNSMAFAKTGGSLLAAVLDGSIDIACSGAVESVPLRVRRASPTQVGSTGPTPQRVAVPLRPSAYPVNQSGQVRVDRRLQLLGALNVGAVTSSGAACDAHAGFGTTSLAAALRDGVGSIGLRYSKWDALVGSITLSNVRLSTNPDEPITYEPVEYLITSDESAETSIGEAGTHFEKLVGDASALRADQFVYPKSKLLSKSFTEAPIGYCTIDAIMHNNSGLDATQLESVLGAMATAALENDAERMTQMLEETAKPGAAASKWAHEAARAVHLGVRTATDYHVDGVVAQGADARVHFNVAESWLPFVQRNFLKESNDCDGSGLLCARMLRQIGVSPYAPGHDPDYDPSRHVWTRAVRNALGTDYVYAATIVGATGGEGTKVKTDHEKGARAKGKTVQQAAGHFVSVLLPTGAFLSALSAGDGGGDDNGAMRAARLDLLYPPERVGTLSEDEREHYTSTGALQAYQKQRGIEPLALDGTVTSEMRIHLEGEERKRFATFAKAETDAARQLGPVMASRVVDLTSTGSDGAHAFYLDFVEATVPNVFGDSALLRSIGKASYQFVFTPLADDGARPLGVAGATPAEVHAGNYALVPLMPLDDHSGAAIDRIREETLLHTLPPRAVGELSTSLDEGERRNATASLTHLAELDRALRLRGDSYGEHKPPGTYVELHVTPRMMWGNPSSLKITAEKVAAKALHGQVDIYRMDDLAPDAALAVIGVIMR